MLKAVLRKGILDALCAETTTKAYHASRVNAVRQVLI